MKSRTVQTKTLLVLVGIVAVAATVALSAASAKSHDPPRAAAGRGADVEHLRGQRGSRVDADEGPDRRHGLHVVRAGGGLRRRDEARRALPALPRLHGRGRARRLGAGGGRGGGADDTRLLPARPAGNRRRRVQRVPRDADGRRRGRRRGRRGGGERHHRLPHRRRPQGGDAELRADRADPARTVAAAAGSGGADAVARDDAPVPARAGLAVPGRAAAGAHEPPVREGPERDRGLRRAQQHRPHRRSRRRSRSSGSGTTSTSTTRRCRPSSRQHGMDLVDAAHLLAMGEIVTTDAGIACFDSKFFYQFWRPITAIRNADKDGNPDTTADPAWQALLGVPGHPEYPSQHGCFTAGLHATRSRPRCTPSTST